MEEKIINGLRHVLIPTGEWIPDTLVDETGTYILDERAGRFQYYPISMEQLNPQDITPEERKELMDMIIQSEQKEKERLRNHQLYRWEWASLPPTEQDLYQQQGELMILNPKALPIGKYCSLKLDYMKKYNPDMVAELQQQGELGLYLAKLNEECHKMIDRLSQQMAEKEHLTPQQPDYLQQMNMCRLMAEEIVLNERVYN